MFLILISSLPFIELLGLYFKPVSPESFLGDESTALPT